MLEISSEHARLKLSPQGSRILAMVVGEGECGRGTYSGRTANSSDHLGLFARVFQAVACS